MDEDEVLEIADPSFQLFATGHVACGTCGDKVPVPILAKFVEPEERFELELKPDLAEINFHSWKHRQDKDEA